MSHKCYCVFMETLREIFRRVFGLDLAISGGEGRSVHDPIVIDLDNDGVALEYQVLQLLQQLDGKKYHVTSQSLIVQGERRIDKITVSDNTEPKDIRCFYFDITKSFSR